MSLFSILFQLLFFLKIALSIEFYANLVLYSVLNKPMTFKIGSNYQKYFPLDMLNDLLSVRKFTWFNNNGIEILSYNRATSEVTIKNYAERFVFDENRLELTINNVNKSDIGTWLVYLQDSNENSRLYIIGIELAILINVIIETYPIGLLYSQSVVYFDQIAASNDKKHVFIKCNAEYIVRYDFLIPEIDLANNNGNRVIKTIVKQDNNENSEQLKYTHSVMWSLNLTNIQFNDDKIDLKLFCVLRSPVSIKDEFNNDENSLASHFLIANNIEIKSEKLTIKSPVKLESVQHNHLKTKEYVINGYDQLISVTRLTCDLSIENSVYIWYDSNQFNNLFSNSTNIIDVINDSLDGIKIKPLKISNKTNFIDVNSYNQNFTCLIYNRLNLSDFLIQLHVLHLISSNLLSSNLNAKTNSIIQKFSYLTLSICLVVIFVFIIAIIILKYYIFSKKQLKIRRQDTNDGVAVSSHNRFYETLRRTFGENSFLKQYETRGNRLDIVFK